MSTTEETEKIWTLLFAKWNEILTKFCRNVLRDSCHGRVTGFNVKHLYTFGHESFMQQWPCILKRKNLPAIDFGSFKVVFNKCRKHYLADCRKLSLKSKPSKGHGSRLWCLCQIEMFYFKIKSILHSVLLVSKTIKVWTLQTSFGTKTDRSVFPS